MTREVTAYQRLTLDDSIDATELHAEAVLMGDQPIARIHLGRDLEAFCMLMDADEYLGAEYYTFKVYSHDFFKVADASKFTFEYENSMIRFMSDIRDYFNKSGSDNVYIHFR